jgi:hypothetical protein
MEHKLNSNEKHNLDQMTPSLDPSTKLNVLNEKSMDKPY